MLKSSVFCIPLKVSYVKLLQVHTSVTESRTWPYAHRAYTGVAAS